MKPIRLFVPVLIGVCAASVFAKEPEIGQGELALVEIVSWGGSRCEPGDTYHIGYLHAKTIETKSKVLPSKFKLAFKRKLRGTEGSTPWNNLGSDKGGRLRIDTTEWIVGVFIQSGDVWEVLDGDKNFALSRPEDMTEERLKLVQKSFKTPLIRVWVPTVDVLAEVLDRIQWRMSEEDFKQRFAKATIVEKPWRLSRRSFRKTIVIKHPNTDILFEFSGVVDGVVNYNSKDVVPVSSSLVSFRIKHPLKDHPGNGFRRPPQGMHYKYIKALHDACISRFDQKEPGYRHKEMFDSGGSRRRRYLFWEQITSETAGTLTFVYWSNTSDTEVTAKAPKALIAEDIEKERASAAEATKCWPITICGNDPMFYRPPGADFPQLK